MHKKHNITSSKHTGFTLVELLLVVAIISVLAAMSVGVIAGAQRDAQIAATRSRIAIIERVLLAELEAYEVRRSVFPERLLIALTNQLISDNGWENDRFLVHFRNLNRMLNADLIRTELPSGLGNNTLGQYPSNDLDAYLAPLIPSQGDRIRVDNLRQFQPAGVRRWNNFLSVTQTQGDLIVTAPDQVRINRSEILYNLLSQIEFGGSAALDSLGGNAFGDNDGDGVLEVVDAFGDPITLQLLQENLFQSANPVLRAQQIANGVWETDGEVTNFDGGAAAVLPVRPDQMRPFLSSITIDEIDGN